MVDAHNFFKETKTHPDRFYLIHYSSQSLYDDATGGLSPRITSIVVMHLSTRQTVSFAIHAVAETLKITKEAVQERLTEIERELLKRFYEFVLERREKYWVHWNMRNLIYGFEHLEHRYRTLLGSDPPHIPMEVRFNLNDMLKERYGFDYAAHPRLKNLMLLQGELPRQFLEGREEAEAFKDAQYIRMNSSTISKVEFFRYVIIQAERRKLRTSGKKLVNRIDRLLENSWARVVAFLITIGGGLAIAWQIMRYLLAQFA